MKIRRVFAMPNQWTFTIPPINEIINRYGGDFKGWIDPFSGENSPAEITNDLNTTRPTKFHLDGLQFLKQQKTNTASGCLYDPPYSFAQAKECYDGFGKDLFLEHDKKPTMMDYWASCKNQIGRTIQHGGIVVCCGWNSNGLGMKRGFEMLEVLIVYHGGSKNDTIVTIEQKIQSTLEL